MKHVLVVNFFLLFFTFGVKAQKQYETLIDSSHNNEKILKGVITKSDLQNDSSFKWYAESQKIYPVPNSDAVKGLMKNKDNVNIVIFGGTWCEDTHFILPKFFKIQEASGFPDSLIALYGVDRNKNTTGTIAQDMHLTNVPTIIVMKNGKEVGRLVEYGKTGQWDKELAEIFSE